MATKKSKKIEPASTAGGKDKQAKYGDDTEYAEEPVDAKAAKLGYTRKSAGPLTDKKKA